MKSFYNFYRQIKEQSSCNGQFGPVYHGSGKDFNEFDPSVSNFGGTIYFTPQQEFAFAFATNSGGAGDVRNGFIYTVCLNIKHTFDPTKKEHIQALRPILIHNIENKVQDPITGFNFVIPPSFPLNKFTPGAPPDKKIETPEECADFFMWRIANGSWRIIESKSVLDYIKKMGYDSLKTVERGSPNIAVFDPKLITIIDKKAVQPNE